MSVSKSFALGLAMIVAAPALAQDASMPPSGDFVPVPGGFPIEPGAYVPPPPGGDALAFGGLGYRPPSRDPGFFGGSALSWTKGGRGGFGYDRGYPFEWFNYGDSGRDHEAHVSRRHGPAADGNGEPRCERRSVDGGRASVRICRGG